MTLDKAIEILPGLAKRLAHISQADEQAATRLGIEALKEIKYARDASLFPDYHQLLGETVE